MTDESELPYRTQPQERGFAVTDHTGRVVVVCSDAANADQYAALLNEAFQRGFKAGYRVARRA